MAEREVWVGTYGPLLYNDAEAYQGEAVIQKAIRGMDLDDLEDLSIVSPDQDHSLFYQTSSGLFENKPAVPASGGTFTGNIAVPNASADAHAVNRITGDGRWVLLTNKASQAEAEAGTDNNKWMTPLRTAQAITALAAAAVLPIDLASEVEGILPLANLTNGASNSILVTLGAADPSWVALGSSELLRRDGDGSMAAGKVTTSNIENAAVTFAKIEDGSPRSVLGRATGSSGAMSLISASFDNYVLKRTSGLLGFGLLTGDNITDVSVSPNKLTFKTISGVSLGGTLPSLTSGNGFKSVSAYNGSAARTFSLGTPSSITDTSTNSVTATSHTHEIAEAAVTQYVGAINHDSLLNYAANEHRVWEASIAQNIHTSNLSGSYTGITGTGALNAGSITSGFGAIDIGSSAFSGGSLYTTGSITGDDSYPTTSTLGETIWRFRRNNNGLEIGQRFASNDRKPWILARHGSTPGFGGFLSTLHLQPSIAVGANSLSYRGVAIGKASDFAISTNTGLHVGYDAVFDQNVTANQFIDTSLTSSGILYANSSGEIVNSGNATVDGSGKVTLGNATATANYLYVYGADNENTYDVFVGERRFPRIKLIDRSGSVFSIWNLGGSLRIGTNAGTATKTPLLVNSGDSAGVDIRGNTRLLSGDFQISSTTVIDSSRNFTGVNADFSGTLTAGNSVLTDIQLLNNDTSRVRGKKIDGTSVAMLHVGEDDQLYINTGQLASTIFRYGNINNFEGSYQIAGTTVIDASRNFSGVAGTFSGAVTAASADIINGYLYLTNSDETSQGIRFRDAQALTTQFFDIYFNSSSEDLFIGHDTNLTLVTITNSNTVTIAGTLTANAITGTYGTFTGALTAGDSSAALGTTHTLKGDGSGWILKTVVTGVSSNMACGVNENRGVSIGADVPPPSQGLYVANSVTIGNNTAPPANGLRVHGATNLIGTTTIEKGVYKSSDGTPGVTGTFFNDAGDALRIKDGIVWDIG